MELISKKELLQQTGISYGQLYRWKREKLIPEEWFIKQSSYTGQETFFPREQILPRIAAILENKDKYSLTELSRRLSPDTAPALVDGKALADIGEIAQDLIPTILYLHEGTVQPVRPRAVRRAQPGCGAAAHRGRHAQHRRAAHRIRLDAAAARFRADALRRRR